MPAAGDEAPRHERPPRAAERLAHVLTLKAGFVDAVGYVALYHLFTADQSGNTDALGVALGDGAWGAAWPRATSIAAFVLGIGIGTLLVEQCRRHRPRWAGATVTIAELVTLAGALTIGVIGGHAGHLAPTKPFAYAGAAATLAGAMGLQTVTLRQVGTQSVRTTFVSGLLTNMAESFVLAWHRPRGRERRQFLRLSRFTGSVWLFYVLGAVAGGAAERAWSFDALGIPLAVVAAIAAWEVRHRYVPSLPAKGLPEPAE